jgi:phytanoyl-CoA hydroxylase
LEEDAVSNSEGKLVVEKQKSVNKIGHGQYDFKFMIQISSRFNLLVSKKKPFLGAALHELDPAFRKVTLENQRLKDLVTDLKFHKDPVGAGFFFLVCCTLATNAI